MINISHNLLTVLLDCQNPDILYLFPGLYNDKDEFRQCKKIQWNSQSGTGLMWKDWGIPIINLLNYNDSNKIIHNVNNLYRL